MSQLLSLSTRLISSRLNWRPTCIQIHDGAHVHAFERSIRGFVAQLQYATRGGFPPGLQGRRRGNREQSVPVCWPPASAASLLSGSLNVGCHSRFRRYCFLFPGGWSRVSIELFWRRCLWSLTSPGPSITRQFAETPQGQQNSRDGNRDTSSCMCLCADHEGPSLLWRTHVDKTLG